MLSLRDLWLHGTVALLCIPPLLYFICGICVRLFSWTDLSMARSWAWARGVSNMVLLVSLACSAYALWHTHSTATHPTILSILQIAGIHVSVRFDLVGSLMLSLVSFLGWVIVNYSRAYMAGDTRESYYLCRLMLTLSAVTLLVVTNNMIVFVAAWISTSLALHGLLTLYPTRRAAVIAAHKKFIASRIGDIAVVAAVILLGYTARSLEIDQVMDWVTGLRSIPPAIHFAALLLALSAIVKCAQLPLHGWLIQVMEAPTPVSALLHAGIVNLGGFMLIRLAAVMNTTPTAQAMLVVVGCVSAVIGSLVTTTRISIKVHLAWSTCAQMGFMLMECGLGLYALALLHLLAHSLYKAYAFLRSGETVTEASVRRSVEFNASPRVLTWMGSSLFGVAFAGTTQLFLQPATKLTRSSAVLTLIVGIAAARFLAATMSTRSLLLGLRGLGLVIAISLLYFGEDTLFQNVVPHAAHSADQRLGFVFVFACFALLYGVRAIVSVAPTGNFAQSLRAWLYAGLYLDEMFTRATFWIWPASTVPDAHPRRDVVSAFEAQGESL